MILVPMQILKMRSLQQEYGKLDDILQRSIYVFWNLLSHFLQYHDFRANLLLGKYKCEVPKFITSYKLTEIQIMCICIQVFGTV